ncbi:MAG: hypothetical protein JRG68_02190 [Deltaproteobacteria bacterium]|nr:hypothetical protein [Deltaproteobacteria bacterium]MBW2099565.1 hypothetical protein [Deltaproteobacteria bacterium]
MMNFFLVDVVCITSAKPREEFDKARVEELADAILKSDGLLKPLILKIIKPERFEVIEGHLEYWAAVSAREKDRRKGEMVNAFVISPKKEDTILEQLQTLKNLPILPLSVPVVKPDAKPSLQKDMERTPLQMIQPLQKEVETIRRNVETLSSLPSQLTEMIKKLEKSFQASLTTCFNQWAEKQPSKPKKQKQTVSLDSLPEQLTQEHLSQLSWDQIKELARDRGIKIKGGRVNIEKQILGNSDNYS